MVLISIILVLILVIKLWLNPKLDYIPEQGLYKEQMFLWYGLKSKRKFIKIY